MTTFWEWFDSLEEKMKHTDVGKLMRVAGFHIAHTGGGCLVWECTVGRKVPEKYLWVCTEDNGLGEKLEQPYLVGVYCCETGDELAQDTVANLSEALVWCADKVGESVP